jgi:opacity protein-like surface antigen
VDSELGGTMIAASRDGRRGGPRHLLFALLLLWSGPALGQAGIGSAVTVTNQVSGILAGRTRAVGTGDGVFANETIRTANASAAQLRFLDQSNLAIGPSASVVLNRFVYNPDQTAREAAVQVTTGAARWVSGSSPPRAYRVRTPHAVIGVRGTEFDLLVELRRTIVTLREGVIVVCPIGTPQSCATLDTPGQSVIVTRSSIQGPTLDGPSPTRFAEICLSPIDRAACVISLTMLAEPARPPVTEPERPRIAEPVRPRVRPRIAAPPTPPAVVVRQAWDSFYAGVHLGGTERRTSVVLGGSASVLDSIALGNVPTDLTANATGVIGGAQFGRLWQFNNAVFGWEADFSAMGATAQDTVVRSPFGIVVTTSGSQRLDYFSTLRARAGIAAGGVLFYGTGGLAMGHLKMDGFVGGACATCTVYVGNRSLWQAGYVAGGGVEGAITDWQSIRFEVLYYDLGSQDLFLSETTGFEPGQFATMRVHSQGTIVRAALNARF